MFVTRPNHSSSHAAKLTYTGERIIIENTKFETKLNNIVYTIINKLR